MFQAIQVDKKTYFDQKLQLHCVLWGTKGSGKSTLIKYYINLDNDSNNDKNLPSSYAPSFQDGVIVKSIEIQNKTAVNFFISEPVKHQVTASTNEPGNAVSSSQSSSIHQDNSLNLLSETDIVILCHPMDAPPEDLEKLIIELMENAKGLNVRWPILIVTTKKDLKCLAETNQTLKALQEKYGLAGYIESSAKTGDEVKAVFSHSISLAWKYYQECKRNKKQEAMLRKIPLAEDGRFLSGSTEAQLELALAYECGQDLEADQYRAFNYYLSAAKKGNADAEFEVACRLEEGCGVPKNIEQAFLWYKKAADHDNLKGQCKTAQMYDKAFGTSENKAQAFYYWEKAANHIVRTDEDKKIVAIAQHNLAILSFDKNISTNKMRAITWLLASAANGCENAIALRDMVEKMTPHFNNSHTAFSALQQLYSTHYQHQKVASP